MSKERGGEIGSAGIGSPVTLARANGTDRGAVGTESRVGNGSKAFWAMRATLRLGWLALVVLVFGPGATMHKGHAQDPPTSPPAGGVMPMENLPRVVGPGVLPDLMYMRNEKGEEILVPRARYEDFERLLMETELGGEGLAATPSLNQLDLVIEPIADYAKVQVRGLIALKKPNRTTWTVPIALSQLQWLPTKPTEPQAAPVSDGSIIDGVESVATSTQSNGYLWRVGPGKTLPRRLELEALCKVVSNPVGTSLRLDLPPAASVLKLKLPKGDWELNATGGGNEVIEPFSIQGEHSIAIVRTSSNSINLTWNRKANREAIAAVEILSQTKFTPTSDANRWRADTACSIRGPIKLAGKRILWTLPPQGTMREAISDILSFSSYRMVRVTSKASTDPPTLAQEKPGEAWWIEIDDAYARSELDLNLEWQIGRLPSEPQVSFSAPEFEGAERHNGTIEFAIPRTNSIDWSTQGNVQLLRQSQAADGSESIVYSFQFSGQPARIATQWTSVAERPRFGSEQRIEVRERRVLLRGLIEFGSDPIELPLLQLEAEGWQPERLVLYPSETDLPLDALTGAGNPTAENPNGAWSLPINANLWMKSATGGRTTTSDTIRAERIGEIPFGGFKLGNPFEMIADSSEKKDPNAPWKLEYLMSRSLADETQDVAFSLPQLSWLSQESQQRVIRSLPGRLLVYSWPYRLTSNPDATVGLVETSLDRMTQKQWTDANAGATPFLMQYQIADATASSRWTGTRSRKGSFVSASLYTSLTPSSDAIQWDLRWNCRCLGSRPTELRIGFPVEGDLDRSAPDATISIDNRQVALEWLEPVVGQAESLRWAKFSVPEVSADASNRLDFLIEAQYSSKQPLLSQTEEETLLDLGLAKLSSLRDQEQVILDLAQLRLRSTEVFKVSAFDGTNEGVYELDPDQSRFKLTAARRANRSKSPLRLEAEWVQTIVNALEQRDRYVARFQTDQRVVRIPATLGLIRDAEWMLDGQRAGVRQDPESEGYATVVIPETSEPAASTTHVLEVYTTQAAPKGWFRRVQPIGPRLQPTPSSAPLVWQIIVPRTEHLISSTKNALPMYQWRWRDLFFRRVGQSDQEEIEVRIGATSQPVLAQQVNQYDLTSVASTQPLEAIFVPSALIWLPVSMVVLALAIVLRDSRWIRWPWFWAIFLGVFFVFSQFAWDISLLVLQAAIVSVGLAILYGLARWAMDRRARRRSIFVSRQYAPTPLSGRVNSGSNAIKKPSGDSSLLRSTVAAKTREPQ